MVPINGNVKLESVIGKINGNDELKTYWKCANITAIDRLGLTDHGPTHAKIVANMALRIFRILRNRGIVSSIEKFYGMSREDAEVVVVLASALHDVGMAIHRDNHYLLTISIARGMINDLLGDMYGVEERIIVTNEILHAILTHHAEMKPLTIEAGIVRIADALDMAKGRARIPFEIGKVNIHSVSAMSIEEVTVKEGEPKPVEINVKMSNSSGIFQVDELLKNKIKNSGLESYIQVIAEITEEKEKKIIEKFEL